MLKIRTSLVALFCLLVITALLTACGAGSSSSSDGTLELAGRTNVDEIMLAADANDNRLVTLSSTSDGSHVALTILELDDGTLQKRGSLTAPGDDYSLTSFNASGLAISDDDAYVALPGSGQNAVWAVDISEPANPSEQSLIETPNAMPVSVAAADDLAVVGTGLIGTGLTLIDISDPGAPEQVRRFEHTAFSTASVELEDDTAFVADLRGVTLVDVSDTSAPNVAGVYEANSSVPSVGSESGDTSSLSDPDRPNMPRIAVDGYLYVANGKSGLTIFDVSDPASPEAVAQIEMEYTAISVTASDDEVHILSMGALEQGMSIGDIPYLLQKVDVSDPANPEVVAELSDLGGGAPSPYQAVVADDDHLYVINGRSIDVVTIAD